MPLHTKKYMTSYGVQDVKVYIEQGHLWVENDKGQSRLLESWEITNSKEVLEYLSRENAEGVLPELTYVNIAQTNADEYSVGFNFRVLGGGGCESKPVEPEPAMIAAATRGDLETVKRLLASGVGADIQRSSAGGTALLRAAESGHIAIVQTLLSAGANVNFSNRAGVTALYIAAKSDHVEVVRTLLQASASVDATLNDSTRNSAGKTALGTVANKNFTNLSAAEENCALEIAQMLIEYGADVNRKVLYGHGWTVLQNASGGSGCSIKMVKLLLEAGARVDLKNTYGNRALQLATDKGVKALLRNPPPRVDYIGMGAAKRSAEAAERSVIESKAKIEQRIAGNPEEYKHVLLRIARSVTRQLFEDIVDKPREEAVQKTLHDFLISSILIKKADVDLLDDSAHAARRASLTTALVTDLREKKYLWKSGAFDSNEMKEELGSTVLIWSGKIEHEAAEKSRLKNIEDRIGKNGPIWWAWVFPRCCSGW